MNSMMETEKMNAHDWVWTGQGERKLFGNPDNVHAVDFWKCTRCGKDVVMPGHSDGPKDGKCPAGAGAQKR